MWMYQGDLADLIREKGVVELYASEENENGFMYYDDMLGWVGVLSNYYELQSPEQMN